MLAPLVLNLLFASLILLASWHVLRSYGLKEKWILGVQVAVIFLTPLPFLIFDGMEHILQTLVIILAVFYMARFVGQPEDESQNDRRVVQLGLVFLLCAIRYEGVFFAIVASILLLLQKRVKDAVLTGCAATAPLVFAGIWFIRHGWPFFPMTIVLKSSLKSASLHEGVIALIKNGKDNYSGGIHLIMLVLLSLFLYVVCLYRSRGPWHRLNAASLLFVLTALAHLACAGIGWGYRYEAYLVAVGVIVVAIQLADVVPSVFGVRQDRRQLLARILALGITGAVALLPLVYRGVKSLYQLEAATHNIYEQQCQVARFVRKYYQGSCVALNDIGAVNFYSRIHCLDLYGLASRSVAKAKMASGLTPGEINRITGEANTRIAILYEDWFYDQRAQMSILPEHWVPVGTWTIPNNVICGEDKVTFFAVIPNEAPHLAQHLTDFSSQLPADVAQGGPCAQTLPRGSCGPAVTSR